MGEYPTNKVTGVMAAWRTLIPPKKYSEIMPAIVDLKKGHDLRSMLAAYPQVISTPQSASKLLPNIFVSKSGLHSISISN